MRFPSAVKRSIRWGLHRLGYDVVPHPVSRETPASVPAARTPEVAGWLSSLGIRTVLDIGAHQGEFAKLIRTVLPAARIVSFEPLPDCFAVLEDNMRGAPYFAAFNVALGDDDGVTALYRSEYSPSSSLLSMAERHKSAFPNSAGSTEERVRVRRLDDLAASLALEQEILVKIDVQGYEHKVLAGAAKVLAQALLVIVETSFETLYHEQELFDGIYPLLRRHGVRYIGSFAQLHHPVDGQVLHQDSMFLHDAVAATRDGRSSRGNDHAHD
jgi:FkbM family methyltransferase